MQLPELTGQNPRFSHFQGPLASPGSEASGVGGKEELHLNSDSFTCRFMALSRACQGPSLSLPTCEWDAQVSSRPDGRRCSGPGAPVIVKRQSQVPRTQPHSRVPQPRGEPLQPVESLLCALLPPISQRVSRREELA